MSLQTLRNKFANEPAGTQLVDPQDISNRAILAAEELVYFNEQHTENLVSIKWTAVDTTLEQEQMIANIMNYIAV